MTRLGVRRSCPAGAVVKGPWSIGEIRERRREDHGERDGERASLQQRPLGPRTRWYFSRGAAGDLNQHPLGRSGKVLRCYRTLAEYYKTSWRCSKCLVTLTGAQACSSDVDDPCQLRNQPARGTIRPAPGPSQ